MTVILGAIEKGKVYIGSDSAGVGGLDLVLRKDPKIFKIGKFIFGCTSSFRMIQILQYSFKPKPQPKGTDIHEYMCTLFIDEIRAIFRKSGYMSTNNTVESGGIFLVGYKGRLFCIESDFQVGEMIDNCHSVGCGADYAIGAFLAQNNKIDVKKRILKSLQISQDRSAGVRGPFRIISI